MKSTFLSRFTPSVMPPETLEAILVQRHPLADDLVEAIRESALTQNKHFRLLIGMRGIGKTHMVTLIYHRISKMEDLRDKLVIAWLREEEWGVTSFLDLLLRIFRALKQEYLAEYDVKLNQPVEALYELSQQEAELQAALLLRKFIGKRTLLIITENLDDLFDGLGDIGQKQLRAYIQNYSFITILATAQSLFDGVSRYEDPFYGFFYPYYLEDLKIDEAVNLLKQIAKFEGDKELEAFISTAKGNSRIHAVHHLAGGNPRVYVIFSQFLTRKSLDELVEPFMRMLDDLTPYYQARMSWLSQQQRKIIEFLVERRHPVTVKEIAQRCFITHQTASSQLKDLRAKSYVISEAIGRESFYELREPLMRFCLEVKKQHEEPIRLFIDFLRCWYTKEELQQRLGIEYSDNFSLDKLIELDPDYKSAWGNKSWALINLEQYEEALISCEKAIALGENKYYVLANRAIALAGLNRWKESLTALEYALKILDKAQKASSEDTELILRILFTNIAELDVHKNIIKSLVELFYKYNFSIVLSQGLVLNIPIFMSETVSDEAVKIWLDVWRQLVGNLSEFIISLRFIETAYRYRISKGDRRVLLELPVEERNLLEEVLGGRGRPLHKSMLQNKNFEVF